MIINLHQNGRATANFISSFKRRFHSIRCKRARKTSKRRTKETTKRITLPNDQCSSSFACIVLSFISLLITGESLKFSFLILFHCGINCLIWLLSTSLILMSFKGIELVKTTAIGYLNIVTVFILGVTFLGEHIYLTDVIGSLIILGFNIYNTMYPPLQ